MTQAPWISALANHLWQSTVLVVVAWLLTLLLHRNSARARYWIWLMASLKFILPFSMLVKVGTRIGSMFATPSARPAMSQVMEQITQPFPQNTVTVVTASTAVTHSGNLLTIVLLAVWVISSLTIAFSWVRKWWQIRTVVRAASRRALVEEVPVLSSSSMLEPGIFGIIKPVLLLPEGITDRLTQSQLNAIVAHEMCHVRRRDNLTFAMHMVVETVFWFHPLVWWVRAHLIEERERACDEAVLLSGSEAEVYAEGILNVCKFYVESPLACVTGVTGSDLKKRIVRIMTDRVALKLDFSRKLLLGVAGLVAVFLPIFFGVSHPTQIHAQSLTDKAALKLPAFEVVSIKPNKSDDQARFIQFTPDGFLATNMPIQFLLTQAFGVEDSQIENAPDWVKSQSFNIEAKVAEADIEKLGKMSFEQRRLLFVPLLEERFSLKLHHETKDLPVYALVISKSGPKLTESEPDPPGPEGMKGKHGVRMEKGNLTATSFDMTGFAHILSPQVGRIVLDKTGLRGSYNFTLKWDSDDVPAVPEGANGNTKSSSVDSSGPSLFTALQEQLGLKLESQKDPVDVIVIDHVEAPTAN